MTAITYATKWTANAIQTPPDLTALVSSGYPTNGDPSKGIPPTLPGAAWFHWVTQSIASVIAENGLTIDQTKTDQVLSALKVFGTTVLPVGACYFYLGKDIPEGSLLMNGASVLRADFPDLFAVIGTTFGAVDEAHFNLPDTHHRFLEGTTTLSEVGTYVAAGLPNSTGDIELRYGANISGGNGVFSCSNSGQNDNGAQTVEPSKPKQILSFDLSRGNTIYGASDTNQPKSLRSLYLIRAYEV